MLAVDAHAHVLKRDLPLVAGRHSAPKRDASVEEYVALDWLEWNGGSLRLTAVGENVCKQLAGRQTG